MTQGGYELVAAQESSDDGSDGSDPWDQDTISTLSPWMAAQVKEMQMAARTNVIREWLSALEY